MKKFKQLLVLSTSALMALSLGAFLATYQEQYNGASAYNSSSLPNAIDLNDTSEENVRSYYSSLNSLSNENRTGKNLLAGLKNILKNGQQYFNYDSGDGIWKMYEIIDRDWEKSPASEIASYNSLTNKITNYSYSSSDPYIHALYVNRDVDNQTKAWADHDQTQWGINREHIWPKSQGFNANGAGGARGDPMHLWAGNGRVNGVEHNNHPYGEVDKSKTYMDPVSDKGYTNLKGNLRGVSKTLGSGTVFEPQDADKGDIARAIFYMVARYNYQSGSDSDGIDQNNPNLELVEAAPEKASYTSSTKVLGQMGILSDLLKWNKNDPPDEFEIHRNNLLYNNYTKNRNPFIDFPEWANIIWGEDIGSKYATPATDDVSLITTEGDVSVTGVAVDESASTAIGKNVVLDYTVYPTNATDKKVTWTSSDETIATVDGGVVTGVAPGQVTITITTHDGSFTDTSTVTVRDGSDQITRADTGITSNSYTKWANTITCDSGTVYDGTTAGGNSSIQLNNYSSNDKYAGIISTTSVGKLKKIVVSWNSNTTAGRTLEVYGKNTAYTATSELYNDSKGVLLGSLVKGTSNELVVSEDYEYIGLHATGALYLDSISIYWDVAVTGVSLDQNSAEIDLADASPLKLTATIEPANAKNKDATWTSSDETVATVDDGVVTALKEGETTITVTSSDGSFTDTCDITVINSKSYEGDEDVITNSDLGVKGSNYTDWSNKTFSTGVVYAGQSAASYGTIQLRTTNNNSGIVTTSSSRKISSISVAWYSSTATGRTIQVYGKNTAYSAPTDLFNDSLQGTLLGTIVCGTSTELNIDGDYTYVGLRSGSGALYAESITFAWKGEGEEIQPIEPSADFPFFTDVAYKMYFHSQNKSNDYFFTGSMSGNYGATSTTYSEGVDVYFDENHYLYFYTSSNNPVKNYISIVSKKFSYSTTTPSYAWEYSSTYSCITTEIDGSVYTLGTYGDNTTFHIQNLTQYAATAYTVQFKETADTYSYRFINNIHCDATGANAPGYATGYTWSDLKTKYNELDSSQRTSLHDATANESGSYIQQAVARYDFLAKKYGLENFMNRDSAVPANVNNVIAEINISSTVMIVIITSIIIGGLSLCYFFFRKKRD